MNNIIKHTVTSSMLALTLGLGVTSSQAETIGFEGWASDGSHSGPINSTLDFGGYNVTVPGGFIIDSANPHYASNGTDWLLASGWGASELSQPVSITGDGVFSLQRFDVSEWHHTFGPSQVTVRGSYAGGGSIERVFQTDNVWGFETMSFDGGWSNLVQVELHGYSSQHGYGILGYDNIVVGYGLNLDDEQSRRDPGMAPVPEPGTFLLLGSGLAGMIGWRMRKGQARTK